MNPNDLPAYMAHVGAAARAASTVMAAASTAAKNAALTHLARRLRDQVQPLQVANAQDLDAARAAGLADALVDRLKLGPKVIETVAEGCDQIAAMPDPVGEISGVKRRPSGISVGQMRVPLGVFGMIYESRPNVTIEAASLAIKSGNACILRGGSEALQSNLALWRLVQAALAEAELPGHGERNPAGLSGGERARIALMRLGTPRSVKKLATPIAIESSFRAKSPRVVPPMMSDATSITRRRDERSKCTSLPPSSGSKGNRLSPFTATSMNSSLPSSSPGSGETPSARMNAAISPGSGPRSSTIARNRRRSLPRRSTSPTRAICLCSWMPMCSGQTARCRRWSAPNRAWWRTG